MRISPGTPEHDGLSGVALNQHHPASNPIIKANVSSIFIIPGWNWEIVTTFPLLNDTLYMIPVVNYTARVLDRISIRVTTGASASSVARMGIYTASVDGDGLVIPNTLLLDAGTVAIDTTGTKSITISETLAAGIFFFAVTAEGNVTLQAIDLSSNIGSPISGAKSSLQSNNQDALFSVFATHSPDDALPSPPLNALVQETSDIPIVAVRQTV